MCIVRLRPRPFKAVVRAGGLKIRPFKAVVRAVGLKIRRWGGPRRWMRSLSG